uniref:Polynucleotide kinase 3'-phosphatase n=1 Tax=Cyprinus carpio TaxID=7962 RepID=A0A8C2BKY6_CYPCA
KMAATKRPHSPEDDAPCTKRGRGGDGDDDEDEETSAEEKLKQLQALAQKKSSHWQQIGSLLLFTVAGLPDSSKIAGLDIDGCIITTKSGKVFPTSPDDWRILFPEIQPRLASKLRPEVFKSKVEDILQTLQLPIHVFASTAPGIYRKPVIGMWEHLCEKANCGVTVDVSQSFYVGGELSQTSFKNFSNLSLLNNNSLMISNNVLCFYLLVQRKFDFKRRLYDPPDASLTSTKQEVIVAVGLPRCDKSTFFQTHIIPKGYVYVNRDILGSWQQCVSACERALKEGRNVVVDNTNPDPESRKRCLSRFLKQIRRFNFTASLEQAKHNNRVIGFLLHYVPVNDMVIHSYNLWLPINWLPVEGFSEILQINFVPSFSDKRSEFLFRQFSEG